MGVYVSKRPAQVIFDQLSKWMPAHQPITFELTRRDMSIIKIRYIYVSGKPKYVELTLNFNPRLSGVKDGQRITIFKGINYKLYTIFSVTNNSVNIDFNTFPSAYDKVIFNDINYYIETTVYAVDNSSIYQKVGTIKSKPNSVGIAKVSVQDLLSTKCINQNNFQYDVINKGLAEEGSRFNISVYEYYNGVPYEAIRMNKANLCYYTNSANQIQDDYGNNMGNYVPSIASGRLVKAKFQSVFERPTYFVGYPFSLNFIYSDNLENYQINRIEQTKDINGNVIANTSTNLNISQRELANRLMLDGSYTSNVKILDVWLENAGIVTTPTYIDSDYTTEGYFAQYQINNSYYQWNRS